MRANIKIGPSYKKHYRMNMVGKDGATTTVAIPPEVIDRKAEEVGLSPEEFVRRYKAVAHYNNFEGVFYAFEKGMSETMVENKLREYREKAGISQVELGRLARMASTNISAIERECLAPWPKAKRALAKALKCTESELFPAEKGGSDGQQ